MNERFWSKVFVWHHIHCWAWLGCKDPMGYGRFNVDNQSRLAHRIAYEDLIGPIPEGLCIDHLCRNPGCCNPFHMEVVTRAENTRRGIKWQRSRTHCPQGHPYDYAYPDGRRGCRRCTDEASRKYRQENREAINARRRTRRAHAR